MYSRSLQPQRLGANAPGPSARRLCRAREGQEFTKVPHVITILHIYLKNVLHIHINNPHNYLCGYAVQSQTYDDQSAYASSCRLECICVIIQTRLHMRHHTDQSAYASSYRLDCICVIMQTRLHMRHHADQTAYALKVDTAYPIKAAYSIFTQRLHTRQEGQEFTKSSSSSWSLLLHIHLKSTYQGPDFQEFVRSALPDPRTRKKGKKHSRTRKKGKKQ